MESNVVMIWLFFCLVLAKTRHMKAKYYEAVMSVVTDLTALTEDDILNGRRTMEVVDARWLCVRLMKDIGLYPYQIAEMMVMSVRAVQYIINNFDDRMKFGDAMLKIYLQMAKKRLENLNEI